MHGPSLARRSSRAVAPLLAATAIALLASCDSFQPTDVINPNVTDDQYLGSAGAGASWLRGTQRQFLLSLNQVVLNSELASDNYFNNYTTNNQRFDAPDITFLDPEVTSIQNSLARLRNVATFGLDTVFVRDTTVTANDRAELLFLRGTANLLAGETFVALPATANGTVATWQDLLQSAIGDFAQARTTSTDATAKLGYTLAIARAHYRLGDKARAVEEATALLAASPAFVRNATFDGVNGPNNAMQGVLTSAVNNLQPLPRLDFLDPKYPNRGATVQSPIAFLKAEEAHLIIAEARLSDDDLPAARAQLQQLLTLVRSRPTELVDSRLQQRGRAGGKVVYPNTLDARVAFAPDQPLLGGFVLTRTAGNVRVPIVSGTSVTPERIDAIATVDDGLYVLYLMRQEIFLAEGRRMADLGLRFPVAQTEILANPNLDAGAPYTEAQVPPFIPGEFAMDAFTYDEAAKTVVIAHDMNRVLVQNRASPFVLPFH